VDILLCERLLTAYAKTLEDQPDEASTEGMWSWIRDSRQQRLVDVLAGGNPRDLADLMASMFAEDFVLGMATDPLVRQTDSGLAARAWGLRCLDGLASLAEAVGVVAVENPEQGGAGLAFDAGLPRMLAALDAELGFRLEFPDVGAPAGLSIDGRLVTSDTPDQIYAALRLDQAIRMHIGESNGTRVAPQVVEIGGGYGAMCHWFVKRRKGDFGSYTVVDLPIVNVLQGYFLGRVLGPDYVSLYGEEAATIRVLPNFALDDVASPFGVLVNKDSMPEMPAVAMNRYLEWGAKNCNGLFYSYNQEAAMEFLGERQGVVHRAVKDIGGFKRLSRNRAWVREGYVEEVYVPAAPSSMVSSGSSTSR
jgi:hypothetical protein